MVRHKTIVEPLPPPEGEISVIVLHLKGGDATLQRSVAAISDAMARIMPKYSDPISRRISSTPSDPTRALPSIDEVIDKHEDDAGQDLDGAAIPATVQSRPVKRSPVRSPEVLELDLNSGDVPLKEFLQKHPVNTNSKKYLLIAFWLKEHRKLHEINMDHVHTCYRHMGWQTPKDAAQPLRDMKQKQQWFHKGEKEGYYKINHVGENEANKIITGKS